MIPTTTAEAAAMLAQCARLGCLGKGDAIAVRLILKERKRFLALEVAADDALSLLETLEPDDDAMRERIEAFRAALDALTD
jgi:hypothetical protein